MASFLALLKTRTAVVVGLLLILGVAAALRVGPAWDWVHQGEEVRFFGNDAYYHLRHAQFAVDHFPRLQRWDTGTHYPNGQRAEAAGLFDLSVAAGSLALGFGEPDEALVSRVLAWTPVVLAVATFGVLFLLAALLWGRWAGVTACLLLLVAPGDYLNRTLLGFSDHHAAEVFLTLLTLLGLCHVLREGEEQDPGPGWRHAFGAALPLALFQFTWAGAPVFLLLIAVALYAVFTFKIACGDDLAAPARASFRYGTSLLATIALLGLLFPDLVMRRDLFPYLALLCAAIAFGLPAYLLGVQRLLGKGVSRTAVVTAAVLLFAVGISTVYAGLPVGRRWLTYLFAERTQLVAEHVTPASWGTLWRWHGVAALLAVAGLPFGFWLAWRRKDEAHHLVPLLVLTLVLLLWWRTQDFAYQLGPAIALLSVPTLRGCWLLMPRLAPGLSPDRHRALAALPVVLALLFPVTGWAGVNRPVPTERALGTLMLVNDGWAEALEWMAEETPSPPQPIDTPVEPWDSSYAYPEGTYGVLSSWDFGNVIAARAKRPVYWSQGLGPAARWWLLQDEQRAWGYLQRRSGEDGRFGYVVVDARTAGDYFRSKVIAGGGDLQDYQHDSGRRVFVFDRQLEIGSYGPNFEASMAHRLYYDNGMELSRLRLVYQSPHQSFSGYRMSAARGPGRTDVSVGRTVVPLNTDPSRLIWDARTGPELHEVEGVGLVYDGRITSSVKIYEVVQGARLVGYAPPGSTVQASATLISASDGKQFPYRRTVQSDPETGRFMIRVPYSNEQAEGSTVYAPRPVTILLSAPREADPTGAGARVIDHVVIPERAVQMGEVIRLNGGRAYDPASGATP